jgi:hypothetical protein
LGVQPNYESFGVQPNYERLGVQPNYERWGVQPNYKRWGVQPNYKPKNNKPAQAGESLYSGRLKPAVFLPTSQKAGNQESRQTSTGQQPAWWGFELGER